MFAGDFALGTTLDCKFTTRRFSTGAPFTLAGTPVISAYPDNSTTQITAGITLSVDFDGVTGLNNIRVVATSGNGYASGSSYYLVITTGTVDSVSVVGEVVGSFTLERSASFGRLGAPAGASVSADVAAIQSDTNDIQGRLPAALVSGRIDASVGAMAADTVTASAVATGAIDAAALAADAVAEIADGVWDEDATGHQTQGTFGQAIGDPGADTDTIFGLVNTIQADTDDIQTRLPAALVGGRMDSSVGAMAANVMTAAAAAADLTTELQTGLSTLDAAGVRTAVGLAAANLDTQLSSLALSTQVDALEGDTTTLLSRLTAARAATLDNLPSAVQRNTALSNFPFTMVDSAGAPLTGLTVSATRRIDAGAFAAAANAPTEIADGWYTINLAAADLNGATIALRFTATGARDRNFTIITRP